MGNTDSRAIGAFGVGGSMTSPLLDTTTVTLLLGFYSVFSVTDKPSITSEGMLILRFGVIECNMGAASKVNFEWDSDNQVFRLPVLRV